MRKILGYLILSLMAVALFAGIASDIGIKEALFVAGSVVAFVAAVHLIHS